MSSQVARHRALEEKWSSLEAKFEIIDFSLHVARKDLHHNLKNVTNNASVYGFVKFKVEWVSEAHMVMNEQAVLLGGQSTKPKYAKDSYVQGVPCGSTILFS